MSGIVFAASWLDHAIAGADPNLRELVMQAIQQTQANSTMSFADVVRGALHQMVLSGTSSDLYKPILPEHPLWPEERDVLREVADRFRR